MRSFLRKQYIGVILTGIVFALVCGGFVYFLNALKQKEVHVREVKETLATYEQNKKIFAEESEKLEAINTRLGTIESKRMSEATVPNILSSFESMALEESVTVAITSVQTPTENGKEHLYIDFSAEGGFDALNAYAERLLKQEYQVRFTKFSIYQDKAVASDGQTMPVTPPSAPWHVLGSIEIVSFYDAE